MLDVPEYGVEVSFSSLSTGTRKPMATIITINKVKPLLLKILYNIVISVY